MSYKSFSFGLLGIVLGVFLTSAVQFTIAAWSAPGQSAPNGNVEAPINVSVTPQHKSGPFAINTNVNPNSGYGLAVSGNASIGGKLITFSTVSTDPGNTVVTKDYLTGLIPTNCNTGLITDASGNIICGAGPTIPPPVTTETKTLNYVPDLNAYTVKSSKSFAKAKIISADVMADGSSIVNVTITNDGVRRRVWNWACDNGNWFDISYLGDTITVWARGDEDCNFGWRHTTHYVTIEFSN